MRPHIPFALLILGLSQMVLKELNVLPAPHVVSVIIAIVCLFLAVLLAVMYWGLDAKETGRRGRA